jgi:hypothetical protein
MGRKARRKGRPLGRLRDGWVDKVVSQIEWVDMNRIDLAHNRTSGGLL